MLDIPLKSDSSSFRQSPTAAEAQTSQPLNRGLAATFDATRQPAEDVDWANVTRQIVAGHQDAFALFYQFQFETMFGEVRRLAGLDEASCLDIVQEAMTKVIQRMKPLDQFAAVQAWARAVARNATYDWLRRQQRNQRTLESFANQQRQREASLPSDESVENEARLLWIQEQLATLPADLRNMISWRYRLGWSLQRIASKMGLKTGAVDGRIRRAIDKLKEQAGKLENE